MRNLTSMLQKVKEAQGKLSQLRADLAAATISGEAGGGAVRATVTGEGRLASVSIMPMALSGSGGLEAPDIGMLEDLIVAAIRDAQDKASAEKSHRMQEAMEGVSLPPGLDLPL